MGEGGGRQWGGGGEEGRVRLVVGICTHLDDSFLRSGFRVKRLSKALAGAN